MTAVHGGVLGAAYLAGASPVPRLEPHLKLVAVLGFALIVVATPVHAGWAWAAYGGYLTLVRAGGLTLLLRRRGRSPATAED